MNLIGSRAALARLLLAGTLMAGGCNSGGAPASGGSNAIPAAPPRSEIYVNYDTRSLNVTLFKSAARELSVDEDELNLEIERLSIGLNRVLLDTPLEELRGGRAAIQLPSDNGAFGHPLFAWNRFGGKDDTPGRQLTLKGIALRHERDPAKADERIYVKVTDYGIRVSPAEPGLDLECELKIPSDLTGIQRIRAATQAVAACAVGVGLHRLAEDPRSPYHRTYAGYLAEPVFQGHGDLLAGLVAYAEYIRAQGPHVEREVRDRAELSLADAVNSLKAGHGPLSSYLYVHARVAQCARPGRPCAEENLDKEPMRQALRSELFREPRADALRALGLESIGDLAQAEPIWARLLGRPVRGGGPSMATLAAARRRAGKLREAGRLSEALAEHRATLLRLQGDAVLRRDSAAPTMEHDLRMDIILDQLHVAALARRLLRDLPDQRAIYSFVKGDLRRLLGDLAKPGDGASTGALGAGLEQLNPGACDDSNPQACATVRDKTKQFLLQTAERNQQSAWSSFRALVLQQPDPQDAAGQAPPKGQAGPGAATQNAMASSGDLLKLYPVACQDLALWSKEGGDAQRLLDQRLENEPDEATQAQLIGLQARCQFQELARPAGWPYAPDWELRMAGQMQKISALAQQLSRRPAGAKEAEPILDLLSYPALSRGTLAYAAWVKAGSEETRKEWQKRAEAATTLGDEWAGMSKSLWNDYVHGAQARELARALKEVPGDEAPRLTVELIDDAERTFLAWAATLENLGSARSAYKEAVRRAGIARKELLGAGLRDLRRSLDPLSERLDKMHYPQPELESLGTLPELEREIVASRMLAFLRLYGDLAAAGSENVAPTASWLGARQRLVDSLISKTRNDAKKRWLFDNQLLASHMQDRWRLENPGIEPQDITQRLEKEAQLHTAEIWRRSQRLELLLNEKEDAIAFYAPSQANGSAPPLVLDTKAAARLVYAAHGPEGSDLADQNPQQRLNWFLMHVSLHKQRYVDRLLPDWLRGETLDLTKAYEAWCARPQHFDEPILALAQLLQSPRFEKRPERNQFPNPEGELKFASAEAPIIADPLRPVDPPEALGRRGRPGTMTTPPRRAQAGAPAAAPPAISKAQQLFDSNAEVTDCRQIDPQSQLNYGQQRIDGAPNRVWYLAAAAYCCLRYKHSYQTALSHVAPAQRIGLAKLCPGL